MTILAPIKGFLSYLFVLAASPFLYVISQQQRVHWFFLLSALILAFWVYLQQQKNIANDNPPKTTLKSFFQYVFPKAVYQHESAKTDYRYFILNAMLLTALVFPFLAIVSPALSNATVAVLKPLGIEGAFGHPNVLFSIFATFLLALVADFSLYVQHYFLHKIPVLWEFHKVHHSAKVLTPITLYRMHPLDIGTGAFLVAANTGIVSGILQHLFIGEVLIMNVAGINIIFFLYYVLGYNLRHTHIWLDYGQLNRVFVSPAMHQIHHSEARQHWDKNLGFIFSCWDQWFKTYYHPNQDEKITYGTGDENEDQQFNSFFALTVKPFIGAFERMKQNKVTTMLFWLTFFGVLVLGYQWRGSTKMSSHSGLVSAQNPIAGESVFIEELTWTEVDDKIKSGFNAVIVPTGGTEQNGPHMVLGKHNYIVRYTAGTIAHILGNMLVAPVMMYVPEGKISPPEGHMRFSGTLSLDNTTFALKLEKTARSLKQHGFKHIYLIGDSGDSQATQKQVASSLNQEWQGEDVSISHIGEYYSANGQTVWLMNKGLSMQEIGNHAGIRDTSELMAVYPEGVRAEEFPDLPSDIEKTGVNGNPKKASAQLGEALLDLKVKAAVAQIKRLRKFE